MNNHSDKVTWSEFTEWLAFIGERRGMGNNYMVNKTMTECNARIESQEVRRKVKNEDSKAIDFTIDSLTLIDIGLNHLEALVVFEN